VSLCFLTQKTIAQNISNEGTDFWAVFPTHVPSANALASLSIFISSKSNSSGVVSVNGKTYPFNVIANSIAQINIPRSEAYIDDFFANQVITNKGIRITVNPGQPKVSVYGHIFARARSEAYLVLPVESLGKTYFVMSEDGSSAPNQTGSGLPGHPYLVLVANEDNTTILITRPNSSTVERITLPKKGDVYEVLSNTDLTGTKVEIDDASSSCKSFAAFSGHSGIAIDGNSYDPLLQQLYPVVSWGRTYGLVPMIDRKCYYKIIASEDNTSININGGTTILLNKGGVYSADNNVFQLLTATQPISVSQFTYSQDAISNVAYALFGDPDMVILNPIEYNIKNITVFSSDLENIQEKYINVFMRTDYTGTFTINGAAPSGTWKPVAINPNYSYLQEPVSSQSLTLAAKDGFNAIAYGFGDHESYAYSAGTTLAANQFLLFHNRVTGRETSAACFSQASDFKLTLPYLITKIIWKQPDGTVIYEDANPSPTQKIVNGQTLYTYLAPLNITFNVLGTFKYMATITIPQTAGNCFFGDLDLNFDVEVDPLPTSDFTSASSGCADEDILFADKSNSNVATKILNYWLWDFDDGTTSTEQNPKHNFSKAGTYNVKLISGAENGCLTDVKVSQIIIKPKVISSFQAKTATCVNTNTLFTQTSTVESGQLIRWVWDFGDGKPVVEKTTPAPFNYSYNTVGTYTVTLTTYSDVGCKSLPYTANITVNALPINDFVIPEVCLSDAQAFFANNSTDGDGSTTNLTYLWDFGDPSSGALNNSTARDGKHKYNAAGDYVAKLTVNNLNGCSVVISKPFTVNGSFPVAAFDAPTGPVCSNEIFTATNTSTVAPGKVTRVEWYIDNVKYMEDEDPETGKVYNFKYPSFTAPATKTITLKLIAFSGSISGSCKATVEHQVVLKAAPVVQFSAVTPICLNNGSITLNATEIGGLVGSGVFSGNGVSAEGVFNPVIAGPGTHEITYTFNAANGCSDAKKQAITVYDTPIIDAGEDQYILVGGEKKLPATANGFGLTYKWSPATGLSRDDILNPIVKPEVDGKYTLTVTSSDGCVVVDEVFVKVLNEFSPPNTFSPNGDGVNDVWNIKYLDSYPRAQIEIFTRNGIRVYYNRGFYVPFDGNYHNQPLPVGVYYYIINPNTGGMKISGHLTIIR
jgi:gliding motility-associated-like protein